MTKQVYLDHNFSAICLFLLSVFRAIGFLDFLSPSAVIRVLRVNHSRLFKFLFFYTQDQGSQDFISVCSLMIFYSCPMMILTPFASASLPKTMRFSNPTLE